jgi:hypothetical protein
MRLSKINTPILALIFGLIAEAVLFVSGYIFGSWGSAGPSSYGIIGFTTHVCVTFHFYPSRFSLVSMDGGILGKCIAGLIFFSVALFQWWLIFAVSITVSRHSRKQA